jgi:hypothetical protein
MRARLALIGYWMLFVVLPLSLFVFTRSLLDEGDKSSVAEDERIGDRIVSAVEMYKAETHTYPDSLSELVPRYMSNIQPPRYGKKEWKYIHYPDKHAFALFMYGKKVFSDGYWYDSDKGRWEVFENRS